MDHFLPARYNQSQLESEMNINCEDSFLRIITASNDNHTNSEIFSDPTEEYDFTESSKMDSSKISTKISSTISELETKKINTSEEVNNSNVSETLTVTSMTAKVPVLPLMIDSDSEERSEESVVDVENISLATTANTVEVAKEVSEANGVANADLPNLISVPKEVKFEVQAVEVVESRNLQKMKVDRHTGGFVLKGKKDDNRNDGILENGVHEENDEKMENEENAEKAEKVEKAEEDEVDVVKFEDSPFSSDTDEVEIIELPVFSEQEKIELPKAEVSGITETEEVEIIEIPVREVPVIEKPEIKIPKIEFSYRVVEESIESVESSEEEPVNNAEKPKPESVELVETVEGEPEICSEQEKIELPKDEVSGITETEEVEITEIPVRKMLDIEKPEINKPEEEFVPLQSVVEESAIKLEETVDRTPEVVPEHEQIEAPKSELPGFIRNSKSTGRSSYRKSLSNKVSDLLKSESGEMSLPILTVEPEQFAEKILFGDSEFQNSELQGVDKKCSELRLNVEDNRGREQSRNNSGVEKVRHDSGAPSNSSNSNRSRNPSGGSNSEASRSRSRSSSRKKSKSYTKKRKEQARKGLNKGLAK